MREKKLESHKTGFHMKRFVLVFLMLSGCASNLRTVDVATIQGASDNVLCSESGENLGNYTKETLADIHAEMNRRGGIDCSQSARLARASAAASIDELCVGEALAPVYFPALGAPSRAELNRRGATCDPQRTNMLMQVFIAKQQQEAQIAMARAQQQQAAAAQQQAANAALFQGLMLMQAAQPTYQPPPAAINCTSTTAGIFTNTRCR